MDFVFNIVKGRFIHLASLPAANDGVIAVVLEAAGLEADETLMDYADLASLLAGTSAEHADMGRVNLTNVVIEVDNVNNWYRYTADNDLQWIGATGNPTGAVLFCYVPDVGVSTDAEITPMSKHVFEITPQGVTVNASIGDFGIARAQ